MTSARGRQRRERAHGLLACAAVGVASAHACACVAEAGVRGKHCSAGRFGTLLCAMSVGWSERAMVGAAVRPPRTAPLFGGGAGGGRWFRGRLCAHVTTGLRYTQETQHTKRHDQNHTKRRRRPARANEAHTHPGS